MFVPMVGVPEFGSNPQVLSPTKSCLHGAMQSFADLRLIAVITGAVEMTVAHFNGLANQLRGGFVFDFPHAEPDDRDGSTG